MLTLQPKTNEAIVLYNSDTQKQIASIKPYLTDGNLRLAFDIPKQIHVTRKPITQGSAGNVKQE
jgi:hypothetical protein